MTSQQCAWQSINQNQIDIFADADGAVLTQPHHSENIWTKRHQHFALEKKPGEIIILALLYQSWLQHTT